MAWHTRTWTEPELITAAMMNGLTRINESEAVERMPTTQQPEATSVAGIVVAGMVAAGVSQRKVSRRSMFGLNLFSRR